MGVKHKNGFFIHINAKLKPGQVKIAPFPVLSEVNRL